MNYSNKQKRELVKQDYDAIANIYVKNCSEFDFYKPFVDEFILSLNGKKVLDAGCGHGLFTNYFKQKGLIAEGVDFSKDLLEFARKDFPDIKFIECDLCDFNIKEKFSGIFVKNVLFHIPDENLVQIFKNFYNFLDRNGKVCVLMEIPKEDGEQILSEEFDEKLKVYYNYMLPEKVEKLLLDNGFEIDKSDIISKNQNATIYAFGLMVIYASKKGE